MCSTLQATFELTTPMFIGDAEQHATGIRPSAIKGALRFWWRAINWPRVVAATHSEALALQTLHQQEAKLFGAAANLVNRKETGGQGIFLLQVAEHNIQQNNSPFNKTDGGLLYLLGMGLATFKNGGQTLRNALSSGEFTLSLRFKKQDVSPEDRQSIADAVWAFGLLGALGSRARHGLGSLTLTDWQFDARQPPKTREEYRQALQQLLGKPGNDSLPPLTAFSQHMRFDLSASAKQPEALLHKVGEEQMRYRSFGQKGKVLHQPAERNFGPKNPQHNDHDLVMKAIAGTPPHKAPGRTVFGLPHNYFFSSSEEKADINYWAGEKEARRASPLLLHVHRLGQEYVAVHGLLPARFLPDGAHITIKAKRRYQVRFSADAADWQILHTYLDRFAEREHIDVR